MSNWPDNIPIYTIGQILLSDVGAILKIKNINNAHYIFDIIYWVRMTHYFININKFIYLSVLYFF